MKSMNQFNIQKSALLAGAVVLFGLNACSDDFERINTNPVGLTSSQISVSNFMNEAQLSIFYNQSNGNWEYQLIQNLNADLYSGYLAVPTPFAGNNNNSLYYMVDGWNSTNLNYALLHVMKPCFTILQTQTAEDYRAIARSFK